MPSKSNRLNNKEQLQRDLNDLKVRIVALFSSFIRHKNEQVTLSIMPVCKWSWTGVPRLGPMPEGSDSWCRWCLHQVLSCPFRTAVLRLWSGWRRLNSCLPSLSARWLTWAPRSRTPPSIRWKCRPKSWRRTSSQVTRPFDINDNINQAIPGNKWQAREIFQSHVDISCTCGLNVVNNILPLRVCGTVHLWPNSHCHYCKNVREWETFRFRWHQTNTGGRGFT